jgi:D-threo-aldose 1-dehydrogenase
MVHELATAETSMRPHFVQRLERSGLQVTAMGFGAAPIGNFLKPISEETSQTMIDRAWDAGLRLFDTAPLYGHGLSELRLGQYLRWRPREAYVLSTKVGRLLDPAPRGSISFAPWVDGAPFRARFDYSYDGAMRSIEHSLQRLALEHIDIAFVHDVDVFTHGAEQQKIYFKQVSNGAYKALEKLRSEGVVKAIGFGVNDTEVILKALQETDSDCMLVANRYTLLEQDSLDELMPLCVKRKTSVIIGGGFNGGILVTGAVPGAKYFYQPAPEPILARVRQMEAICARHQVPLAAVAMQFVLAHPAVVSHVPGTRTVAQLEQLLTWNDTPIPPALWSEMKHNGLIRQDAPVPVG